MDLWGEGVEREAFLSVNKSQTNELIIQHSNYWSSVIMGNLKCNNIVIIKIVDNNSYSILQSNKTHFR